MTVYTQTSYFPGSIPRSFVIKFNRSLFIYFSKAFSFLILYIISITYRIHSQKNELLAFEQPIEHR